MKDMVNTPNKEPMLRRALKSRVSIFGGCALVSALTVAAVHMVIINGEKGWVRIAKRAGISPDYLKKYESWKLLEFEDTVKDYVRRKCEWLKKESINGDKTTRAVQRELFLIILLTLFTDLPTGMDYTHTGSFYNVRSEYIPRATEREWIQTVLDEHDVTTESITSFMAQDRKLHDAELLNHRFSLLQKKFYFTLGPFLRILEAFQQGTVPSQDDLFRERFLAGMRDIGDGVFFPVSSSERAVEVKESFEAFMKHQKITDKMISNG